MQTQEATSSECPAVEDLSAWYDSEADSTAKMGSHVASCDACKKIVHDFELINASINEHIQVPSETIQRIHDHCLNHAEGGSTAERWFSAPIWFKLAACFVLIGMIVVLKQQSGNAGKQLAEADVPAPAAAVAEAQAPQDNLTPANKMMAAAQAQTQRSVQAPVGTRLKPSAAAEKTAGASDAATAASNVRLQGTSDLDLSDIKLVAFGSPETATNSHSSRDLTFDQQRKHNVVDPVVHHVWVMDDPTTPLQVLRQIMPDNHDVMDNLIEQNLERYHLRFKILDNDLQGLVNHFERVGCELISPVAPQPGQGDQLRFNGKAVHYEVDFVRN